MVLAVSRPTMEGAQLGSVEKAAFDEILADLRSLLASLEKQDSTNEKKWTSPKRPDVLRLKLDNNKDRLRHNGDTGEYLRVDLRHRFQNSGSNYRLEDKDIKTQTFTSNTTKSEDLLESKSLLSNKVEYCNNSLDKSEFGDDVTRKHGESRNELPASQQFINYQAAGNYEHINKSTNGTEPYQLSIETTQTTCHQNETRPREEIGHILSGDSVNSHNQEAIEESGVPDPICKEDQNLRRSSPVIGRKYFPEPNKSRTFDKRSATLEGRSRKRDDSIGAVPKAPVDYRTLPYQTRTQSLRRAISKKLGPFRRTKPKLKTVKSLPTHAERHHITDSEYSAETKKNRSSDKVKGKKLNGIFHTAKDDSKISSKTAEEKIPSYRRATSLDEDREFSTTSSGENKLESEDGEEVFDSLLCYNKKKKSHKKFVQSAKSFFTSSSEKSRSSFDSGMKYSHEDESITTDISSEIHHENLPLPNRRVLPTSKSLTNILKLPSQANGRENGNIQPNGHDDRDSASSFRRSTIGSSYLRETGLSTPNIYQINNAATKTGGSQQTQFRRSLHIFKDQNAVPESKNENRWSTEDGLPKGTSFHSHVHAQEIDKLFKGSFKVKFQKSTKSGNKLSSMANAGRNKLTERTWNSIETCVWNNLSGQRVELGEIDLLSLSESECVALQKIAEQRLRDIDLGVSITVPKDESKGLHGKHNNSVLKRLQGGKNKSKKDQDHVFSIPLVRVVENDQLLRLQTVDEGAFSSLPSGGNDDDSAPHSSTEASPKSTRRISLSQDSSAEHSTSSVISSSAAVETDQVFNRTSSPSTPPNESPVSRRRAPGARTLRRRGAVGLDTDTEIDPDQKKVLESLESSTRDKKRSLLPPTMPQVPYVVQKCCAHILKHGLDVTGIFRIAGSKKRVKQLREEFDHGVDVKIDEDYHAHDVAALLKEFIRDLPEALLTRELYQAFISTAKLSAPQRLSALRCLVWLLPMPNRDTLQQLLSFLETVAEHAEDRVDATGKVICGNKMSVANLSVIFGPNLLHRYKKTGQSGADAQYQVQSMERAEESTFVIKIIDEMIRSQKQLFMIPRESHDEILRTLQESDPDAVDFLLRRKAANYTKSPTAKTPTDRPEESDSASESTERSTIQNGAPYSPLQSDMNNNKNNNKGKLNEKEEKFDSMRSAQDHEREGDIKPLYERSFSKMSFTPKKDGSVSFTDEDLNAILGLDNPVSSKSDHSTSNLDSISETRAVEAKERHVTDFSTKTVHLSSSEKTTSNRHQPEALQIHYSRRQAFSLSPDIKTSQPKELSSMEKRSDTNSPSGGVRSRRRRSTDPDQPQSVNHNLTSSSQPKAEHNTSTDSDPWIKNDTETTFSEDAPMRGRLRSGLNVRLNRVHGPESGVVLHSLRIPKNQSRRSAETPSDMKHRTAAIDRRLSKDDMCLTLRSMRQTDIFI